jgi:hypothetical protein
MRRVHAYVDVWATLATGDTFQIRIEGKDVRPIFALGDTLATLGDTWRIWRGRYALGEQLR